MDNMFFNKDLLEKFAMEGGDANYQQKEPFACNGCDYTCDDFGENFITSSDVSRQMYAFSIYYFSGG